MTSLDDFLGVDPPEEKEDTSEEVVAAIRDFADRIFDNMCEDLENVEWFLTHIIGPLPSFSGNIPIGTTVYQHISDRADEYYGKGWRER